MLRQLIIFISVILVPSWASLQEDTRKTEKQIAVEDKFVYAKLQLISGKSDEALKILDTLRRENKDNPAIVYEMAKIHAEAGNIGSAEDFALQALKLDPDNIWYRIFYAGYMTETGKFAAAADAYKILIGKEPKNKMYYDKLVELQLKSEDYNGALRTLDNMEQQIGLSEQIIFRKAEILDNTGRVKEAVTQIERLIKKYPDKIKYHKIIAGMLKSNGMDNEALPYYRKILDHDPTDSEAAIALMASDNAKSDVAAYISSLIPLLQNPAVDPEVKIKELLPYVLKHAETADPMLGQKLREACDILTRTHPDNAKIQAMSGDVYMNSGEIIQAVQYYQSTIKLNDRNYLVWEQWMYGLERLMRYEELSSVADRAIDMFPNFPMPYYFGGVAALQTNLIDKAKALLEEASMIAGNDKVSRERIAMASAQLYLKQKKYKEAHQSANEAYASSDSRNLQALELIGDIFFAESNIKEALIRWKEALAKGSKSETLISKIENSGSN